MVDKYGRPNRMAELPEHTLNLLRGLDEEEVEEIKDAIKFMRSVKTVGTFGKWLIITCVAIFISAVSFGEAIMKIRLWFTGIIK